MLKRGSLKNSPGEFLKLSRTLKPKLIRDKRLDLDPIWDNLLMPKGDGATLYHLYDVISLMTSSWMKIPFVDRFHSTIG